MRGGPLVSMGEEILEVERLLDDLLARRRSPRRNEARLSNFLSVGAPLLTVAEPFSASPEMDDSSLMRHSSPPSAGAYSLAFDAKGSSPGLMLMEVRCFDARRGGVGSEMEGVDWLEEALEERRPCALMYSSAMGVLSIA